MEQQLERRDFIRPILVAVSFTSGAELFYLIVWGVILFPGGPFMSKLVWTATCGVGMGSVIAAGTNLFVAGRSIDGRGLLMSPAIFFTVCAFCAALCSRIDSTLNYFGGAEHTALFILGGLIPAAGASLLYAWLLHSADGRSVLLRIGI